MQAIHKPAGRPSGVCAAPNLHEAFFHPNSHSLIKDETLPLPVFVPKLLLVGGDPSVELEDTPESFAAEKR